MHYIKLMMMVGTTNRLGVIAMEDKDDICKEMKENFIAEFEEMRAEREETEVGINSKAQNALKESELQLAAKSPQYGLSKQALFVYNMMTVKVLPS